MQEFQIATNRYTAESGRSAASAINVVTRSGSDQPRGNASVFFRDKRLQALPATYDRSQEAPPFSRQQYALARSAARSSGASPTGSPPSSTATRTGPCSWASATSPRARSPHASRRRRCGTGSASAASTGARRGATALTLRYAFEHADDTGASTLDRSIGSASQRQASTNGYNAVLGSWVQTLSSSSLNTLSASYSRFRNDDRPGVAGRAAAHVPVDPGRQLVPRAAGHEPGPLPALGQPRRSSAAPTA